MILKRIGAFARRHKKAEEELAEAAGIAVGWQLIAAAIGGAAVASAAILAPSLIDVSNNNGPGAAAAFRAAGVQAVEAKATEGLAFRDRDYPIFRTAAAHQRRAFGGYLFLHPYESGAAQARYFLAYAQPRPGDLQPVVDSETGSPTAAAPATYAALHELVAHGYRPILYASSSYLAGLVATDRRIAAFRVWQAEYGPILHHVAGTTTVAWQFTDRAHVNGFSIDGSHLLVRTVAQLEIPKPTVKKPRPTTRTSTTSTTRTSTVAPKPKAKRTAATVLRAKTGYWSWLSWLLGEGPWKGYSPAVRAVRPHVPHRVPAGWWRAARAHVRAAR